MTNQPIEEKWKRDLSRLAIKYGTGTEIRGRCEIYEIKELTAFIENLLEQERERIRTFLKDSSVWDAEYIYHRKSLLLEKYDSFINPSRYH